MRQTLEREIHIRGVPLRRNYACSRKRGRHRSTCSEGISLPMSFLNVYEVINLRPEYIGKLPVDRLRMLMGVEKLPPAPCEIQSPVFFERRMNVSKGGKLQCSLGIADAPIVFPCRGIMAFGKRVLDRNFFPVRGIGDSAFYHRCDRLPFQTRHEFEHEPRLRVQSDGEAFAFRRLFR